MEYKKLAESLVKKCLNRGADAAEVYLEKKRELRIRVRNGEIETIQENASHGVGFRVFIKGRMAFSHCNDFSPGALTHAVNSAVIFARNTTPDKNNVLPTEKGVTEVKGLYDPSIDAVPMEKKIDLAVESEKLTLKTPGITRSAGAGYSEEETEIFLANSNGLSKNYRGRTCTYGISVVAEKGEQKSSGSEYCSRRSWKDLDPPKEIAKKAAAEALGMLDPRMVKTQKAAVIFDPDVAYAVLLGILRAVDGERVLRGASFLAKQVNRKVASELLTVIDDGTRAKGLRSRPFDGEGVPTGNRKILEKGTLKGFMYNTITAARAGVKSTGNASRRDFESLPGIGAHNFYMAAGKSSPQDIIKNTRRGLLLKGVTGYGINPVNGNFSGGASGFWIEKGKILFPVKGLTIAGTAQRMLNDIDMVGTDLDLDRRFTSPTFRIKEMQIGGE